MNGNIKRARTWMLVCLLGLALTACFGDEKIGVSYTTYNHTDEDIVSIVINGEGGIQDASAHEEGSRMCCVVLPEKWRPGLIATIKWQLDGDWQRDAQGKEVIRDGKKVLVPGPWKEQTVEVPRYISEELDWGTFYIHIFPNNEVKVLVNKFGASSPHHPFPHPSGHKGKE